MPGKFDECCCLVWPNRHCRWHWLFGHCACQSFSRYGEAHRSPVAAAAENHWAMEACALGCATLGEWRRELDGAVGLVNLVGRSVDCIKTPDSQDEILRSRVEATRVLGLAVRSVDSPPPVWVQMSTAHIYGDPPQVTCTEDSPLGYGLAPFVGRAWEEEFRASVLPNQARSDPPNQFYSWSRPRRRWRRTGTLANARPAWLGRPSWLGRSRHELASRKRHESHIRART